MAYTRFIASLEHYKKNSPYQLFYQLDKDLVMLKEHYLSIKKHLEEQKEVINLLLEAKKLLSETDLADIYEILSNSMRSVLLEADKLSNTHKKILHSLGFVYTWREKIFIEIRHCFFEFLNAIITLTQVMEQNKILSYTDEFKGECFLDSKYIAYKQNENFLKEVTVFIKDETCKQTTLQAYWPLFRLTELITKIYNKQPWLMPLFLVEAFQKVQTFLVSSIHLVTEEETAEIDIAARKILKRFDRVEARTDAFYGWSINNRDYSYLLKSQRYASLSHKLINLSEASPADYDQVVSRVYLKVLSKLIKSRKLSSNESFRVDVTTTQGSNDQLFARIDFMEIFSEDFYLSLIKMIQAIHDRINLREKRLTLSKFFVSAQSKEDLLEKFTCWGQSFSFPIPREEEANKLIPNYCS